MAAAVHNGRLSRWLGVWLLTIQLVQVYGIIVSSSAMFGNKTHLLHGLHGYELAIAQPFNACSKLHDQDLNMKIALVQRGDCNFVTKVRHAQEQNASAVVVMDSQLRESAWEIIMQGDENASFVQIPSVFISYQEGEQLIQLARAALPWKPVQLTLNGTGEIRFVKTKYRMLKRTIAFFFFVSILFVFFSACIVLAIRFHNWVLIKFRSREARQLPTRKYVKQLRNVLAGKPLVVSDIPEDENDAECCSICLCDYEVDETVKVLPCNHFFHAECIDPWLEARSRVCPLCHRQVILSRTVRWLDKLLIPDQLFQSVWLALMGSYVLCLFVNTVVNAVCEWWP